jgi:hypothetical protein
LGLFEIYQISIGQNKARKTLFINMSAQRFAHDLLKIECKDTTNFGYMQVFRARKIILPQECDKNAK